MGRIPFYRYSALLIFLLLLALATTTYAAAAVSLPHQDHVSILKTVLANYYSVPSSPRHSCAAFEAKDYERYIDRSAPVTTMPTTTTAATIRPHLQSSATTDLLVSGPALSFIIVLTLGAFMF